MEINEPRLSQQQTRWADYHQGYESIYNASYEFGFVFVDEDEIDDDDDAEFYEDNDSVMIH